MVSGLPKDFPCPPKEKPKQEGVDVSSGLFVRSELPELDNSVPPVAKKPRIEIENELLDDNKTDPNKKVKFCENPPVEFLMCPDSEYDRSTGPKLGKWKKYLMQ